MKLAALMRKLAVALMAVAVLLSPVVHRDGPLWIIAVAATVTAYYGMTARVVYAVIGSLFAVDVLYGGDAGTVSIAYTGAVLITMFVRRFVALPAWAQQDGWRVSDAFRTVLLAWCICAMTVIAGLLIGDVLYGYGKPWIRIGGLLTIRSAVQPVVVAVLACIVIRRMAIPFRRAILFGI